MSLHIFLLLEEWARKRYGKEEPQREKRLFGFLRQAMRKVSLENFFLICKM